MESKRLTRRSLAKAFAAAPAIIALGRDALPTTARAQQAETSYGRYFAETGHNLREPFLSRWNQAGGVNGLGMPISEERYDDDLGVTQDFESARLLFDPGLDFPWTIQSDPLPADLIESAVPEQARERVDGCENGAVFCEYFPETGHTISGRFVSHWSLHGDLAIFGKPVSEPFEDRIDGKEVTVQAFERMILEDRGDDGFFARPVNRERVVRDGLRESHPFRPAPPTSGSTKLVSSPQGLRLRDAPSTDSDVVAVLLDNAEFISVPGEDGAWIPGYADGYSGWVSSEFLVEPPPLPEVSIENWNPSIWQGVTLSETNVRSEPTTSAPIVETLPFRTPVTVEAWVEGEEVFEGASQWSKLSEGRYVYTRNVGRAAPVAPPPLPPDAPAEGRWIDVHLTQQLMTAYEGREPVRVIVTTTGMSGWETPEGTFWISVRVPNETMRSGAIGAEHFYQLDNVLYTQYFTPEGHAIHYAWWRTPTTIGRPGSHGCLNTLLEDARFLWDWADVGTRLFIRSR
jgi:lipoprotein-anchoring transpeptidase ErfK/SrfK